MASFIARAVDGLVPATRDWFPDDTGSVHEADIDIIAENGITIGYPDGRFGPLDPVTRGQMARRTIGPGSIEIFRPAFELYPDIRHLKMFTFRFCTPMVEEFVELVTTRAVEMS